jgi:hypothetical protein
MRKSAHIMVFESVREFSCSKLNKIWTRRALLLVEIFHVLKVHTYSQETLKIILSLTAQKFF